MRCINLARLLFDNIFLFFLFFSFIFVAPSTPLHIFCACFWDFYGLIRFCAYILVIVSLAEGAQGQEGVGELWGEGLLVLPTCCVYY